MNASVFSSPLSSEFISQEAVAMRHQDFEWLLRLEAEAALMAQRKVKVELLEDLSILISPCIRLLFLAFEENSFHRNSPGGLHVLKGLLKVLPDSKIVEDAHGVLRLANKKFKNRRMTYSMMQHTLTRSNVFDSRNIHQGFVYAGLSRSFRQHQEKVTGLKILMFILIKLLTATVVFINRILSFSSQTDIN